jgi:hypothetical protein
VPKIILLVTDGVANVNAPDTINQANLAKAAGATVYTVGVTNQIDAKQLSDICTAPSSDHYFYVSDFSLVKSVITSFIQKSCLTTSTVSATTSSPSSAPLSYALDVPSCSTAVDIILILDDSTSIVYAPGSYDNWYKYILGFATDVANAFELGPNKAQIGVIKFSDVISPVFYLNKYTDKASLISAIQTISLEGGETNIAGALRTTRTTMFSQSNGARPGARKLAFLLTDGVPNREQSSTFTEGDLLKSTGALLYTIGVTSMTDPAVLQRLCTQPYSQNYFYVSDYSQLKTIVNDVVGRSCNAVVNQPTSTLLASLTKTTTRSANAAN